jgi:malonyl-CoA O-methyltransferase
MATSPSAPITPRSLDAVALARVWGRMQASSGPPWLHGEVGRRMAARLALVRLQPEQVLDWGSFLGDSQAALAAAYPRARRIEVEPDAAGRDRQATRRPGPWWSPSRWAATARPPLKQAEVPPDAAQLLWANMQLHGSAEPQAVLAAWHRALKVGGFLMFSTLGPGSLASLRRLYAEAGWPSPMAPLVDMHDLGDMLVQAGFTDPVMDQETLTLTWADPKALLAELRTLGGNVDPQRHPGLRTPRWRQRLLALLAQAGDAAGRVALRFEVVYGHAFKAAPRHAVGAETMVPLHELQAMARGSKRRV